MHLKIQFAVLAMFGSAVLLAAGEKAPEFPLKDSKFPKNAPLTMGTCCKSDTAFDPQPSSSLLMLKCSGSGNWNTGQGIQVDELHCWTCTAAFPGSDTTYPIGMVCDQPTMMKAGTLCINNTPGLARACKQVAAECVSLGNQLKTGGDYQPKICYPPAPRYLSETGGKGLLIDGPGRCAAADTDRNGLCTNLPLIAQDEKRKGKLQVPRYGDSICVDDPKNTPACKVKVAPRDKRTIGCDG